MDCPNKCHLWARCFNPSEPMTLHHPNCSHVNDSLIDVWKVRIPGESGGCVTDDEASARQQAGEDPGAPLEVVPMKMHREIFEALGEFAGF